MPYTRLQALVPYSETAFRRFYDEMLSNEVFARHFNGPDHIEQLMGRLLGNYRQSLYDSTAALQRRYRHIGIVHFREDIPYEVFISGTRLLSSVFSELAVDHHLGAELVLLSEEYFRVATEAMVKGFLDEFIADNLKEVGNLKALIKDTSSGTERNLLIRHYEWLTRLLTAVRDEDIPALRRLVAEELDHEQTALSYIRRHLEEIRSVYGPDDIERIRFRLLVNANSIAFYLQQRIYSEALSLIVNLLEVYKLTLILDSVINNIIVRKAEYLIEEKSRLSETDPLTEVYNRRKLDAILEGLVLRSHRTAQPLTLCILDVDDFKGVNDRFGHAAGDRVLVELAHTLQSSTRKHDFVARFGGEEFVVVFSDTDLVGATRVAEKVRYNIQHHDFDGVGRVTVSLGLATLHPDDDEQSLFERADAKLYEAKSSGKNRVSS